MSTAHTSPLKKLGDLSAEEILAIPIQEPEQVFARSADEITNTYREFVKKWFPDVNHHPKAADVFRHVTTLREKAKEKLVKGTWSEAGYVTTRLKDGRTLRIKSDKKFDFELGTAHISANAINYVINREHADLFQNAIKRIGALTFLKNGKPDAKLKDVYSPSLPIAYKTYETDDTFILTVKKKPDDIRLRDLLPRLPKDTCAKHVAWITSRLHEMVRYLDHAGISHNAITLDTVFASPSDHTIGLFGGWWYAAAFGEPLKAVPGETTDYLPDTGSKPILADGKPDREMIRAAARELLGDRGGTRLIATKAAPQPMTSYLRMPSSGNAQKDIQDWYQSVLPPSFGARRFTELPLSYSDIYQPVGG